MSLDEYLENLINYAVNESDKVYDYLSRSTKKELNHLDKNKVVRSLYVFFHNKMWLTQYKTLEESKVEVTLKDHNKPYYEMIELIKEDGSWKLSWNEKCVNKYT